MFFGLREPAMPSPEEALPGRDAPMPVAAAHTVLGHPLTGPFPEWLQTEVFGLGCFWGAERLFWQIPGVHTTAVGYSGGETPNPTYREVCSGMTGHTEAVLVVYDPKQVTFDALLKAFDASVKAKEKSVLLEILRGRGTQSAVLKVSY